MALKRFSHKIFFFLYVAEDEKLCKKVLYLMSKFPLHQKLWDFKDADNSSLHTYCFAMCWFFLPLILQFFWPYKELNYCFGSMKWTYHYKKKPRCGLNINFSDAHGPIEIFLVLLAAWRNCSKRIWIVSQNLQNHDVGSLYCMNIFEVKCKFLGYGNILR